MLLRKLSIFGFKSFADKTELSFGEGMTAVIGPNGSGKSNVVDSIRWVFGEQKASALRSTSMQDVIFSGTTKRKLLNMAEVTLTIANTKGLLPIEYSEVAITRRIYRSGESEYLINKTPCRLKDIHNMFLDTGIGSSAYTTIENSMINKILSDKAEERRILFEEASGIGKYKSKIKETQRKLERTTQDLLRINDRVTEKERYVRMLSRQVEKAKRYKRYIDDLKSLEVGYENGRYKELTKKIEIAKEEMRNIESSIDTLKAQIATYESKIEKFELDKLTKEEELQNSSLKLSEASDKINRIDRDISVSNESLSYLRENVKRFENEALSYDSKIEEKQILINNIETSLVERESKLNSHTEEVNGAKNSLDEFEMRVEAQREKTDDLSSAHIELINIVNEKKRELSNAQTNLANIYERIERDEAELGKLEESKFSYRELLEKSRAKLNIANESFGNLMKTREALVERINNEEEKYHKLLEKEKTFEAVIDSTKSKLKFLEGLENTLEGYTSGVKIVLNGKLPGVKGMIADFINISDRNILPIAEQLIGDKIQTVVFDNSSQLASASEFLYNRKEGSARFISMDRIKSADLTSSPQNEGVTKLKNYVSATDSANDILIDYICANLYIAESEEQASRFIMNSDVNSSVITENGTIYTGDGTVIAGRGKKESSGILQRKMESELLSKELKKTREEYANIVNEKEIAISNRDDAKKSLIEIDSKIGKGREIRQEEETTIRHCESELESIAAKMERIIPTLTESRNDISKFEDVIEKTTVSLDELTTQKEVLEGQIESAKEKYNEMRLEKEKLSEHYKNVEIAKQGLTNRIEQDSRSIVQLTRDIEDYKKSKIQKIEDKNTTIVQIDELQRKIEVLQESLKREIQRREELSVSHAKIREGFNGITASIDELRHELKEAYRELEEVTNNKNALGIDLTRNEEYRRSIREKIYSTYEVDLHNPEEELPIIDSNDTDAVENISMLKERLKRVGDVNMGAIAEYETESAELKSMANQRDDLQTGVNNLEIAIKKLNKEARTQFVTTFEEVKKNFKEMFATLFDGGEAHIELEENIDPLYAPIKINVRPAGKKMRGITLLSGGERALTAISLLFALYLVKPSAYCILDELDAPLDDANVDRFVKILRKFAEKTQFIVITHNKHTMEAADMIYGVTQQERGVSSVASLKLNENYELKVA